MQNNLTRSKITLSYKLDVILAALLMIVPMVPYLNYVLHGLVFSYITFFIWLVVIGFKPSNLKKLSLILIRRSSELWFLLLFILVIAYNYFFIDTNRLSLMYLLFFIYLLFVLTLDSYYTTKPENCRSSIFFFIIVALGIQAAISIPYFLSTSISVARKFTRSDLVGQQSIEAMKNGIGGSVLYLAIVPLLFLIFAEFKKHKGLKQQMLLASFIFLTLSVFLATFFTPLVCLFIGIALLLVRYRKRIGDKRVIIGSAALIAFLIFFYKKFIASTNILEPIVVRFNSFVSTGTTTSLSARDSLLDNSLQTFFQHPLFGIGIQPLRSYDLVGGHNIWVDFLSYFGILGFLPLVIFLGILIKKNIPFYFNSPTDKLYKTGCFIGVCIFLMSNMVTPSITQPIMLTIIFFFCVSSSNYLSKPL